MLPWRGAAARPGCCPAGRPAVLPDLLLLLVGCRSAWPAAARPGCCAAGRPGYCSTALPGCCSGLSPLQEIMVVYGPVRCTHCSPRLPRLQCSPDRNTLATIRPPDCSRPSIGRTKTEPRCSACLPLCWSAALPGRCFARPLLCLAASLPLCRSAWPAALLARCPACRFAALPGPYPLPL